MTSVVTLLAALSSFILQPAEAPDAVPQPAYKIGPGDRLSIRVFEEPDLSMENVAVDRGGALSLPLGGEVTVLGLTPAQLSAELTSRFAAYVVDPKVSVTINYSAAQKVIIEGAVINPGVYELKGRTTLLEAVALARGPSRVAALDHVAIIRTTNGMRSAALFDLRRIRKSKADDPEIRPSDVVVVGLSNIKALWRDAVAALPALAIFRPLAERPAE